MKLTLTLLLGLVLAQGAEAQESPEEDFYRALQQHAQAVYKAHKERLPEVREDLWNDASRQAILRLRQAKFFFEELVDFAAPAARTFVVTNVFSTFIAPPLFTALGHPEIGALIFAIPFEPFVAAAQVVVMNALDDLKILKSIGPSDYLKLRKLRQKLLEYPRRHHIITLIESDVIDRVRAQGGPLWLAVTHKGPYVPHGIQLSELEELAERRPAGRLFMKSLLPHKAESRLYGLELWYFVNEDEQLRDELVSRVLARMGDSRSPHELLSRQVHELIDLKRELASLQKRVSSALNQGAKTLKFFERGSIKRLSSEIRAHTIATSHAATQLETEVLLAVTRNAERSQLPDMNVDAALEIVKKERDRLIRIESEARRLLNVIAENPLTDRTLFERSIRAIHLGMESESGSVTTVVLHPVNSLPPCPTLFGRFAL
ncbi:MAG: hypothetical protein ACK5QT_06490 [Oligoflexia bacterium]